MLLRLSVITRSNTWMRSFTDIRLALATRPAGIKATIRQVFYLLEAIVLARHLTRAGVTQIHNHFAMASSSVRPRLIR